MINDIDNTGAQKNAGIGQPSIRSLVCQVPLFVLRITSGRGVVNVLGLSKSLITYGFYHL